MPPKRRSAQTLQTAARYPKMAIASVKALELVLQGLAAEPARKRVSNDASLAKEMLQSLARYSLGQISDAQAEEIFNELKKKRPRYFPTRPTWLDREMASKIVDSVRAAQESNPSALKELFEWLKQEFTKTRGAPISKKLETIYRQAALMRRKPKEQRPSWLRTAQKLCPLREQTDHVCDKKCADRMRMGAKEYL